MKFARWSVLFLSVVMATAQAQIPMSEVQLKVQPDSAQAGSIEAIAEFTTEARFLSPWVAYVPASETVPAPSQVLGHIVGAAGELTHSAQIVDYVRQVGLTSKRVQVETIGRSEEGREIILAVIADEKGIQVLDELKAINARLADPRTTTPTEAELLIDAGRPAYYFNCNLHADETGSGEMCMELIYRLAVSEQPMIKAMRENLLILINPVSEPDGRDKVTDWFYKYLKGKTDFDSLPRISPPYWGKYVFVDINRDAHQKHFAATRAVSNMYFDYHPAVVHDLHEAISLLLTWNGTGPYNPNLDPIVTSRWLEMSFHEMTTMNAMGMPGVWTWNFGEGFGHMFLDSIAINHNGIGRGYETFGSATAETFTRHADSDSLTREWYRPWPPEPVLEWSMRDNVNYQQTAALSILDWSAKHAKEIMRDFYRTGYNSWQKGVTQAPYAYVIPAEQADRLRMSQMINRLRDQQIEVSQLDAPIQVGEGSFKSGDFIVKLDQPYRNFALDVLEPQHFPENYEELPYDDVSWAYPVGFDVQAIRIDDKEIIKVRSTVLDKDVVPTGELQGRGTVYLLADNGQEALLAARYRLAGFDVNIAESAFDYKKQHYPIGSWIISAGENGSASELADVIADMNKALALDLQAVASQPDVATHQSVLPRLGLWVPWADTDMMGWIRYVFDTQGIPYTYLRDEDLRSGDLENDLDVIVYGPFSRLQLAAQIHGIPATDGPIPFKTSADFPSLGKPVESDDISGGPGYAGLAQLLEFVESGGVLITLGSGTALALEGGMVRGVAKASADEVFTPGAEIKATFLLPAHPIRYGYADETSVFRTNLPVYETPRRWLTMAYCTSCLSGPEDNRHVVLRWGGEGSMVVSGGMRGEGGLSGKPAILDTPTGKGHIVSYNFNGIHRDMNPSDYRLIWNTVINWNALSGFVE